MLLLTAWDLSGAACPPKVKPASATLHNRTNASPRLSQRADLKNVAVYAENYFQTGELWLGYASLR